MNDHIGDVTKMVPMTQQRLDEITKRCEAATPGPWKPKRDFLSWDCNAAFIAHARQDIPALLAEVERLQSFRDRIITLPSCCSCGSKGGCPHEPLPGMYERINCPLWIGRKEG